METHFDRKMSGRSQKVVETSWSISCWGKQCTVNVSSCAWPVLWVLN